MTIQELLKNHQFAYPENLIMAFIGGSTQHGAKSDEASQSDTDYYGIFIPPKEKTLGIDSYDSFVYPGDVSHRKRGERDVNELDIALHSLQKWAGMAAKGNPTVLSFLFSKLEYVLLIRDTPADDKIRFAPWDWILEQRVLFLAKSHHLPFLHYAHDQMQRLLGLRGQKNINRDHLVDLYGYDTKYAMHIIRLLSEAKELMLEGKITYPRPEVELLKDIRRGKYKLTEIHQMGEQLNNEVLKAAETSSLPEKVDRAAISKLIADVHLEFYA
jgi:uncharacterized protein